MTDHLIAVVTKELNYSVEDFFSGGERKEERREQIREFGRNCFQLGYKIGYETGQEILKKEIEGGTQIITILPLLHLIF